MRVSVFGFGFPGDTEIVIFPVKQRDVHFMAVGKRKQMLTHLSD
jgi:hypothetical protein